MMVMVVMVMMTCVSSRRCNLFVIVVFGPGLGFTAETHPGGCLRVCSARVRRIVAVIGQDQSNELVKATVK